MSILSSKPPGLLQSMFQRPPQDPLAGLAGQLDRLGASPQPSDAVTTTSESTVLADIACVGGVADLLAVAFKVTAEAEGVRIQLRAKDGSILDETAVPTGIAEGVLFMPPVTAYLAARTAVGHLANAELQAARLYALSPAVTAPDKLAVVGDLSRPFDWSRAYEPPSIGDVGARLRARLFQVLSEPAPVPMTGGSTILLQPSDELSRALFITGYYEPEAMAAVQALLPKGGVFVDIGAHCGVFTLFAAKRTGPVGKVLAFEPSSREFARLAANVDLNGLENVIPIQAAVSDVDGETTLLVAEARHAGHNTTSASFAYPAVRLADHAIVVAITLDLAMAKNGLTRCDVIKTDIEGATLKALQGGEQTILRHRPAIIFETFEQAMAANDTSIDALVAWLQARGYAMHDLDPATGKVLPTWNKQPDRSKNVIALSKR